MHRKLINWRSNNGVFGDDEGDSPRSKTNLSRKTLIKRRPLNTSALQPLILTLESTYETHAKDLEERPIIRIKEIDVCQIVQIWQARNLLGLYLGLRFIGSGKS